MTDASALLQVGQPPSCNTRHVEPLPTSTMMSLSRTPPPDTTPISLDTPTMSEVWKPDIMAAHPWSWRLQCHADTIANEICGSRARPSHAGFGFRFYTDSVKHKMARAHELMQRLVLQLPRNTMFLLEDTTPNNLQLQIEHVAHDTKLAELAKGATVEEALDRAHETRRSFARVLMAKHRNYMWLPEDLSEAPARWSDAIRLLCFAAAMHTKCRHGPDGCLAAGTSSCTAQVSIPQVLAIGEGALAKVLRAMSLVHADNAAPVHPISNAVVHAALDRALKSQRARHAPACLKSRLATLYQASSAIRMVRCMALVQARVNALAAKGLCDFHVTTEGMHIVVERTPAAAALGFPRLGLSHMPRKEWHDTWSVRGQQKVHQYMKVVASPANPRGHTLGQQRYLDSISQAVAREVGSISTLLPVFTQPVLPNIVNKNLVLQKGIQGLWVQHGSSYRKDASLMAGMAIAGQGHHETIHEFSGRVSTEVHALDGVVKAMNTIGREAILRKKRERALSVLDTAARRVQTKCRMRQDKLDRMLTQLRTLSTPTCTTSVFVDDEEANDVARRASVLREHVEHAVMPMESPQLEPCTFHGEDNVMLTPTAMGAVSPDTRITPQSTIKIIIRGKRGRGRQDTVVPITSGRLLPPKRQKRRHAINATRHVFIH